MSVRYVMLRCAACGRDLHEQGEGRPVLNQVRRRLDADQRDHERHPAGRQGAGHKRGCGYRRSCGHDPSGAEAIDPLAEDGRHKAADQKSSGQCSEDGLRRPSEVPGHVGSENAEAVIKCAVADDLRKA